MLLALLLCLAPTPKPVDRLEPHHLVGRWACVWGTSEAWFAFHADGHYFYGSGDGPSHVGRWDLRDNELRLVERSVFGVWETEYVVALNVSRYPTAITGTLAERSGFTVTLSDAKRFPD